MIVTSSACDHSSRNDSGWPWLCLVIAAWQRSTNALSSRIEVDSCTGIVTPPSVTSEGEADDARPNADDTVRWNGVVLLARDDQQRPALWVLGVDLRLGPGVQVRGRGLEERHAGAGQVRASLHLT